MIRRLFFTFCAICCMILTVTAQEPGVTNNEATVSGLRNSFSMEFGFNPIHAGISFGYAF
ncbi:MAG: hypothetical protein KJ607_02580 [Bacteroidetes bacterium]|nr:hypothetical protein [Bacteroidota bacterium]